MKDKKIKEEPKEKEKDKSLTQEEIFLMKPSLRPQK